MKMAVLVVAFALSGCIGAEPPRDAPTPAPLSDWPSSSNDVLGSRAAVDADIAAPDVPDLGTAWVFQTDGAVTGTPTVWDGTVYFGTWQGSVYAVDLLTGQEVWHRDHGAQVDSTTTVWNGTVYVSDMDGDLSALDAITGELQWQVRVDDTNSTHLYSSPTIWAEGPLLIMPVASDQESIRIHGDRPVDFRGQLVAYEPSTGAEVWRTYLVPEGQTGAPVWGGVVIHDGTIYFGTGNAYTAPAGNWTDTIMALDAATGAYVWHHQTLNYDVFTQAKPFNPDHDFGSTPSVFPSGDRMLVGIGQKSSIYWAADATTGEIVWQHGESSQGEGIIGDSAYANGTIIVHQASKQQVIAIDVHGQTVWQHDVAGPLFSDPAITAGMVFSADGTGAVAALDLLDGAVIWEGNVDGGVFGGLSVAGGHVLVPSIGDGFQSDRGSVTAFAPGATGSTATNGPESDGSVALRDFQFLPGQLTISAGTTVEWVNDEDIYHTATSGWDNGTSFDFELPGLGDTAQWTFETPGQYVVYCKPHAFYEDGWQGMVMTITVE